MISLKDNKSWEYVYIPSDVVGTRRVLSGAEKKYLECLKYELILEKANASNFEEILRIIKDYGIKIYSLTIVEVNLPFDILINELKNHPLERVCLESLEFDSKKSYYEFMKFLHSVKTLDILIVDNLKTRTYEYRTYEPIDVSYIKKISMCRYSEYILERSILSSLDTLEIYVNTFDDCDLSLYINKVKKLKIHGMYGGFPTERNERLIRFISKVSGVENFKYDTYYDTTQEPMLIDFVNNNRSLRIVSVGSERMLESMIRILSDSGTMLDSLYFYPEYYRTISEFVKDRLSKNRVAKNICNYTGPISIHLFRYFSEKGFKPLTNLLYKQLDAHENIENIYKICFNRRAHDRSYEILERPGNIINEIETRIDFDTDTSEELIKSLKSEHCKVNKLRLDNVCSRDLLRVLRLCHKKLIFLMVNCMRCDDHSDMKMIANYLIHSNIEHLIIRSGVSSFGITTQDLAKLIVKTKEIDIRRINFIDCDDDHTSIDKVLSYLKDKHSLNKKFYCETTGMKIQSDMTEKSRIYGRLLHEDLYYSFRFQMITKINSDHNIIKRIKNGESIEIEDDLITSIVKLHSDIVDEILKRIA